MRRIDKIMNMTSNRNDSTMNMNQSVTPVSKFRNCSQNQKVNTNNMKIPRNDDGQIEECTMVKLWSFHYLDYNNFPAIQPLSVEYASSITSSQNEISPILLLKETVLNPIKDQFTPSVITANELNVAAMESTESVPKLFCQKTILKPAEMNVRPEKNNAPSLNLACEETMPDSSSSDDNSFYEDSDDSVCDKDYVPPLSSTSSDSSIEIMKAANIFPSFLPMPTHEPTQNILSEQQNVQDCLENIEILHDTAVINTNYQHCETNVKYYVDKQQDNQDGRYTNTVNEEITPTKLKQNYSYKNKQTSEDNVKYHEKNQQSINLDNKDQIQPEPRRIESSFCVESENNTEYYERNQQSINLDNEVQIQPETRRDESTIVQDLRTETEEENANNQNIDVQYTKQGTIRKRRKMDTSLAERKKAKLEERELKQDIKSPCTQKCPKKCIDKLSQDARLNIHENYWKLGWEAQGVMLKSLTSEVKVKSRKNVNESNTYKRNKTYKYFFRTADNEKVEVCKTFFLTTLGYNKKNDKRLLKTLEKDISDQKDKRGKHNNRQKINTENLENHVLQYNPAISHYRREHAPRRRYLSSDVTLKIIYEDYKAKYPDHKISYEFVRNFVTKKMNISFAALSNEECETCTAYNMHKAETQHSEEDISSNCVNCTDYLKHKDRYINSREEYQNDVKKQENNEEQECTYFSADLQKVVMLPRIDMFKVVLFTPRIICFNESFVPLSKFTDTRKAVAVLWNEVISGRKQEDIISAFRAFLLQRRDDMNIVIWTDNCSSQNKNWAFMTFLVQMINSNEITAEKIVIKYLEPGHTFMSADSFHHLVEKSLQKQKKVYDFNDYVSCVETCTKNVIVKKMTVYDFFQFQDKSSQHRLRNSQPRVYLKDIAVVQAIRGSFDLHYKICHKDETFQSLSFLQVKILKLKEIPYPDPRMTERGIADERKKQIIQNLCPLMPVNRRIFWENLSVNNVENLATEDEAGENEIQ